MLREILDVLDYARNSANPFFTLLPEGDKTVEITPFESDLGRTDFIKFFLSWKIR